MLRLLREAAKAIGMEVNGYKEKVFDESLLQFCLRFLELNEHLVGEPQILRQAVLDALGWSRNMSDLTTGLESLSFLPQQVWRQHAKEILDANTTAGQQGEQENHWLTLRYIKDVEGFTDWADFFTAIKSLGSSGAGLADFYVTTRCLAKEKAFSGWAAYFKLVKTLAQKPPAHLSEVFVAIRHVPSAFASTASFQGIFRALAEAPEHSNAFAYGQLDSKKWLIEEATKVWGKSWGDTVFVLAGWIGLLPRMMYDQNIQTKKIRSFDIDKSANLASEIVNQSEVQKDWEFKSSFCDVTQITYPTTYNVLRKDGSACELTDMPDVVINTSCEHIPDIASWWAQIPLGTKVILQSNDGFHISEHVSCFKTLKEFSQAMKLSRIDYEGEKALPEFNRFMLIGIK